MPGGAGHVAGTQLCRLHSRALGSLLSPFCPVTLRGWRIAETAGDKWLGRLSGLCMYVLSCVVTDLHFSFPLVHLLGLWEEAKRLHNLYSRYCHHSNEVPPPAWPPGTFPSPTLHLAPSLVTTWVTDVTACPESLVFRFLLARRFCPHFSSTWAIQYQSPTSGAE